MSMADTDLYTLIESADEMPCDGTDNGKPCGVPAEWIWFWSCGCANLCCSGHLNRAVGIAKRRKDLWCDVPHFGPTRYLSHELL